MSTTPDIPGGPIAFQNWIAADQGGEPIATFEHYLYTDAHITGQVEDQLGPYKLLNTIAIPRREEGLEALPAVVLRHDWHISNETWKELEPGDSRYYHGGHTSDEIAALISLCLGIRLKPGPMIRSFYPDEDPKGRPMGYDRLDNPEPTWTLPQKRAMLPRASGTRKLNDAVEIASLYPRLSSDQAIALARAARSYQDALWIADTEPQLAWLLLVSAVESVASQRVGSPDPIDQFYASALGKSILPLIEDQGNQNDLVQAIANATAPYLAPTGKFVGLLLDHMPAAPEPRPPEHSQIRWSRTQLRKSIGTIYDRRSRALHDAEPIPYPMCVPPRRQEQEEGVSYSEKSIGLGMGAKGAFWWNDEAPMLLHTFEHIVRHAILGWWRSSADSQRSSERA